MSDTEVLGHLLRIEAEAAALVNDAQAEADRRLTQSEKQNRAASEARYQAEAERLEAELQSEKEKIKNQYHSEIETYRKKLVSIQPDTERFSACLDSLLAGEA